jgi:hypothetical protein
MTDDSIIDRKRRHSQFRHGYSRGDTSFKREYDSWTAMRERVFSTRHHAYARYGGRGITICHAWASFPQFLADMGPRPAGCTLDRINTNGHYEPTNCRWATWIEQQNNRRDCRLYTLNGRTQSLSQWARELGIKQDTAKKRLNRGWSVDKAFHR